MDSKRIIENIKEDNRKLETILEYRIICQELYGVVDKQHTPILDLAKKLLDLHISYFPSIIQDEISLYKKSFKQKIDETKNTWQNPQITRADNGKKSLTDYLRNYFSELKKIKRKITNKRRNILISEMDNGSAEIYKILIDKNFDEKLALQYSLDPISLAFWYLDNLKEMYHLEDKKVE